MKYHFKVDSCRLSIPLNKCTILNQELLDHFTDLRINESTGEQTALKKFKGVPYTQKFDDGTSVKIWIEPQISYNKTTKERYTENYITLLVNSKHLKGEYFKGITKDTLPQLHAYMMSLNVFKCAFKDFSNARYADVDICFDFQCDEYNFKILKENIIKSALNPIYFHTTNQSDNSGIWTPTKRDPRKQATPTKPFIKFYSKEKDFLFNSTTFANTYFREIEFKDLVRFECTIKNTAHKKRLGLDKIPTFSSLLNSDLQFLGKRIFSEYFIKPKFVNKTNLKPMDKVVIDMMNELIEMGASRTKIQDFFNRYDVSPKARQRLLEKYNELYESDVINKKKLEANQVSKNVFEFLGLDLNQTKIDFREES
jgi:hypothetical protein